MRTFLYGMYVHTHVGRHAPDASVADDGHLTAAYEYSVANHYFLQSFLFPIIWSWSSNVEWQ